MTTAVAGLSENLGSRADAIVAIDAARADATTAYQGGARPLDDVLVLIDRQTAETMTFLRTLTEYNEAIAEYVFRVVPQGLPSEQVVASLVLP
jgi:hypothetical protein